MEDTFGKVKEKRAKWLEEKAWNAIEAISVLRNIGGYLHFCETFRDDEDEVAGEYSQWEGKINFLKEKYSPI